MWGEDGFLLQLRTERAGLNSVRTQKHWEEVLVEVRGENSLDKEVLWKTVRRLLYNRCVG